MDVDYTKKFLKQFAILPVKMQEQFYKRLDLFLRDPTNRLLRLHPLKGEYKDYWSINVSGDFRALFYYEGETIVVFALIGTHSQLYG